MLATGKTTSAYTYQKKMVEDNNLTSVKSHMIWGSNYDAMLRWALTGADAIKFTSYGNAAHDLSSVYETVKETIAGKKDRINNIYDLEENGWEYTAEAYSSGKRSVLGGYYRCSSSASYRTDYYPTYTESYFSSRQILYTK